MRESKSLHSHWVRILINFIIKLFIFPHQNLGFMPNFPSLTSHFEVLSFYKDFQPIHQSFSSAQMQQPPSTTHLSFIIAHFSSFLAHFSSFLMGNLMVTVLMCILYLLMIFHIHKMILNASMYTGMKFTKEKAILRRMMELVYKNGNGNHINWAFVLIHFSYIFYLSLLYAFQPFKLHI